jgi:hypothetical protein
MNETVLYHTQSACAVCGIVEQRGLQLVPAAVIVEESNGAVVLAVECPTHGRTRSVLSTHAAWYRRMLRFDPPPASASAARDLEDLVRTRAGGGAHELGAGDAPLMNSLVMYQAAHGFLEDADIRAQVARMRARYAAEQRFVLRLTAPMVHDLAALNRKVLVAEAAADGLYVLVELSEDRIGALCALPDSAFLRPRVFPALRVYLDRGEEPAALAQLRTLLDTIAQFRGIRVIVSLLVSAPLPDLTDVLRLLRARFGFVRAIILSIERPADAIVAAAERAAATLAQASAAAAASAPGARDGTPLRRREHRRDGSVVVGSGREARFSVEAQHAGSSLHWVVRTAEADIGLAVSFVPAAGGPRRTVVPYQRVSAHLRAVEGSLTTEPGIYELQFDNTYSKLRKKTVSYEVVLADGGTAAGDPADGPTDPYDVLAAIEAASRGSVTVHDFVPMRAGKMFEPLLAAAGFGQYLIRPPPMCAFGTVFLNSASLHSVPVSRFVNLDEFYWAFERAFAADAEPWKNQGILGNLRLAQLLRRLMKHYSLRPIPDPMTVLLDASKAGELEQFAYDAQFLLVHSNMDVGTIDLRRRGGCFLEEHDGRRWCASCLSFVI